MKTKKKNKIELKKYDWDLRTSYNLCSLAPGEEATVFSIPEIALLPSLGLRIGKTLRIITRSIVGGPIIVGIDGRLVAVDKNIASKIMIKRLTAC